VPEELRQIALEVSQGLREVKAMKRGSKWGGLSGWQGNAENVTMQKMGYDASSWGNGMDWQPW